MPKTLIDLLDLPLALARTNNDIPDRVFLAYPHEMMFVQSDVGAWLTDIEDALRDGEYQPGAAMVCNIPKGGGLVRPGVYLSLSDRVVYAACVGACLPYLLKALSHAEGRFDFSYPLADDPNTALWLRNPFRHWMAFRQRSLQKIAEGYSHVVIADITGYYEHIDLQTLAYDLRSIGAPAVAINQLAACLNKWAQVGGRGIPQGHSASDILGKIYLDSIDVQLQKDGFSHYRYVDDIRIFCKSSTEAKRAFASLSVLLRSRGLSIQSSKSRILTAAEARSEISGIQPIIGPLLIKYLNAMAVALGFEGTYFTLADTEGLLDGSRGGPPLEIIREAYDEHVINGDTFNKTLFRFLLNRLGKHRDETAVDHVITLFEPHPEVTDDILGYLQRVGAIQCAQTAIVDFLGSDDAVYEYQRYQMLGWLGSQCSTPSVAVIRLAHRLTFDQAQPWYVRAVARRIVGDHGAPPDLERLQNSYRDAQSDLEQAEVIYCIRRMEKGRRNAFIGRVAGDGQWQRRAATLVRNTTQ